jgi:predicted Zn finger-like uncharacterized protein
MIIECEKCKAKFNLDESLLKGKRMKVKCSICKEVFVAYLPPTPPPKELQVDRTSEEEPKETEIVDEAAKSDFDIAFEGALDEDTIESRLEDEFSEEDFEIEQDLKSEEKDAFEITKEETEAKVKESKVPPEPIRPARRKGPSGLLLIILLVILILLGGIVALNFIAPQYLPKSLSLFKFKSDEGREIMDAGISKLSFKGVTGTFIQSAREGQLFVIKGMVVNEYSNSRSYILVKGTILDSKGQVVKRKLAYAGNFFPENRIKEMTLDQINKQLKNRPGNGNINVDITPGRAIPFMIILGSLPEDLSEFTVEAVSSSPGR